MADHAMGNIALCILPQSAQGTVNSTITGLTDTLTTADGLIIGAGETGDGDSGIDLATHNRIGTALARIGNSAQADQFVREVIDGLAITYPLAGARNTASNPTVDGDFSHATHFPGNDAVLKAGGLTGAAWGSGVGHIYTPSGSATYATVGVWFGGLKAVYLDCLCEITLTLTPGEAGLVKATFQVGSLSSWGAQALTTITPGNQATASPVVQAAANAWGATRPFEALEITIAPNIEESPDSNATTGTRRNQDGIDISFASTIYAATSNADYERDQLILTSANTDDMTMLIPGAATANAGVANSYRVQLNNVVPRDFTPVKLGSYLGWEVNGECKAVSTAGTEFSLIFV